MKKWLFRFSVTGAFLLALLALIVFAPALSYARQSSFGRFTVYHQQPLAAALPAHLAAATARLRGSELYTPAFHADICLNDPGAPTRSCWASCCRPPSPGASPIK